LTLLSFLLILFHFIFCLIGNYIGKYGNGLVNVFLLFLNTILLIMNLYFMWNYFLEEFIFMHIVNLLMNLVLFVLVTKKYVY